jgi:glycosyltransferase involved in cell wall biosynthesis
MKHRSGQDVALKIALVHYTYPPAIGGVEIVIAEHARLFAEHGHEVTVFCRQGISRDPRILVQILPEIRDPAELADALEGWLANQDVVFLHNVTTMPFYLALTAALWRVAERLSGVRFVAWIHDIAACNPDYDTGDRTDGPWGLLSRAHPRYECVAVSDLRRRQWEELTGVKCQVISNGLDPSRLLGLTEPVAELARQYHLLEREIVLLHPTRLLRRKNVELGLRVAAALKSAGRSCAYVVTGPPDNHNAISRDYAAELIALRRELDLEGDALFLHEEAPVDERDLASLFAVADALFFPSRQEGFGLPILEAALHRLPIFCAAIEPLDTLLAHGVMHFQLDAEPSQIALRISARLGSLDAWQARNQVRRQYAWPAVYRNFLAPLLAENQPAFTPKAL